MLPGSQSTDCHTAGAWISAVNGGIDRRRGRGTLLFGLDRGDRAAITREQRGDAYVPPISTAPVTPVTNTAEAK